MGQSLVNMNRARRGLVWCCRIVKWFSTLARVTFLLAPSLGAAEPTAAPISFRGEIAPIFVARCLGCHSAEKAKGGYRLHTFAALMTAGSSEDRPINPGNAARSKLFQLLVTPNEDDRMPQKDEALTPSQIGVIKQWIEQGARFDGEDPSVLLAVLAAPGHPPAPRSYRTTVPITALAFDPSGQHLAAGGYHEITLWNSETGQLEQRIGNVAEKTFDLAFSHHGRWLACASGTPGRGGEVRLFNGTNGEPSAALVTLADAALCLAFSPDGKKLAAGGADNIIRIWDVESRKLTQTIEQHADWVLSVAFSPDGERLASGSRDKSARIFNVASGELEETYAGHGDFVTAVAWADAKSVLSAPRSGSAHRWNAENAKKIGEFSSWEADLTRLIADGTNVFVASLDRKVRQHTAPGNGLVRTFSGHQDAVYSIALHSSSGRLASGGHDGEVRIWRIDDGALLLRFLAAPGYTPKFSRAP